MTHGRYNNIRASLLLKYLVKATVFTVLVKSYYIILIVKYKHDSVTKFYCLLSYNQPASF